MPDAGPFISYSANHEDVLLNRIFGRQASGFFVDVGAAHPVYENDTKALSDRGWTGINIEPSAAFYQDLLLGRPQDTNLNCVITDEGNAVTFFEVLETGLSTCDEASVKHAVDRGFEVVTRTVEARQLCRVLEDAAPREIDILKVDVEGLELKVLLSNDWQRFRPKVILVEATFPESPVRRPDEVTPFLISKGYRHVYFDGLNDYYAENQFELRPGELDCPVNLFDNYLPYAHAIVIAARDSLLHDVEILRASQVQAQAAYEALDAGRARQEAQMRDAVAALEAARASEAASARSAYAAIEAARAKELAEAKAAYRDLEQARACDAAEAAKARSALEARAYRAETQASAARVDVDRANREITELRSVIGSANLEMMRLRAVADSANQEVTRLRGELSGAGSRAQHDAAQPPEHYRELVERLTLLDQELKALRASSSWRITRPLRGLARPGRTIQLLLGLRPR